MFIRRTKTRQTANGEAYYSHRLVRSERRDGRVSQRTLLNLGTHFDVAQSQWPTLCARLEQLLGEQDALLTIECSASVESQAQRLAAQLLARSGAGLATSAPTGDFPGSGDVQTVDVDSLEWLRPRSVAVERLGLWAMQQVGLVDLLEQLGVSGPLRSAALGSIIGRMAAPGSERATYGWLSRRSALGELLDVDFEAMSLMQLYRASDALMAHRDTIERHLYNELSELFGLTSTVALYDLTNTYFEGAATAQPKARHGASKEKRSDCRLLTLGLVLDGSGFVCRSQVLAGNVREDKTLAGMLEQLDAPPGALVVMDRGIATEANIQWLREQQYRYLVVSRERVRTFDFTSHTAVLQTASRQNVHLNKVLADDGEEVRLYCYSEQRADKERGITQRFTKRFEAELEKIANGLTRPRTHKQLNKIWERIGRLKERSRGIGQHYHIEVTADASGKKATAIRWQRQPIKGSMLTTPGVYCLRSNLLDWDEEKLWRTYIMLTDLEAVFRTLKSELGLRPIYHHKEIRADGHLFITVLAYQLVQLIRRRLGEAGQHDSWSTLRNTLEPQRRITAVFKRPDGRTLHVRKTSTAEPQQLAIYNALGIDPTPGGVRKMIV